MTAKDFVSLYLSLFAGRPDTYAFRTTWTEENAEGEPIQKSAYIPTNYSGAKETTKDHVRRTANLVGSAEYGKDAVLAHMHGKQFLGVYPLHEDSTVKFAALDFDGDTPEEAWHEATRHYDILTKEARLPCYIERSQSGNGYHIWLFFAEPIDAGLVRKAIKQFINKTEWFDRMFPNQSRVSEHKPLGNLIALPLFAPKVKEGNNTFVSLLTLTDKDEPYPLKNGDDLYHLMLSMDQHRIPKSRIEELAKSAPELNEDGDVRVRTGPAEEGLSGGSKLLDQRFGCSWVRWMIDCPEEVDEPNWYALACNLAQLRDGRDLFHEISAHSIRYNRRATDKKFDQAIEKNAPHTCQYIRESLSGPGCDCDKRFPNEVWHPYGLAKIPIFDLMKDVKGDEIIENLSVGLDRAYEWGQQVEKDPRIGQGYSYGISSIDEYTGLRNATLNILAARPSLGKTAWALDIAYRAADSDVPVYFFSLEMSKDQLWRRMLARAAGISLTRLVKGQLQGFEWKLINEARQELKDRSRFPLFVDDSTRDIRRIMDVVWNLKEAHGHGIVMVDYLGLLDWQKGENEYAGVTRNSKESKLMAKALDMPVLLLHQFNRQGVDMSIGAETSDEVLRSSGQIEQDADVIMFMLGERGPGIKEREIVLQKERDREPMHRIMLEFDPSQMKFYPQGARLSLNVTTPIPTAVQVTSTDDNVLPWEAS